MKIYLYLYEHDIYTCIFLVKNFDPIMYIMYNNTFNVSSQTLELGIYRLMVIVQKQGLLGKGKVVSSRCVSYVYTCTRTCTCS